MRHILQLSCLVIFLSVQVCFAANGVVTRVLDGDTVDVATAAGSTIRLRLAGIGAPELQSLVPCEKALGLAAQTALSAQVQSQVVRYELLRADKYQNRWVALVYVGDVWMSEWLVRQGLARWKPAYRVGKMERAALKAAEAEAQMQHRGMWVP